MSSYIETHCHLDFKDFDKDRHKVLQQCTDSNISDVIIPSVSEENWAICQELAVNHCGIHAAIGLHPWWVNKTKLSSRELQLKIAEKLSGNRKSYIAIGECGLDKCIDIPLIRQLEYFNCQLELASGFNMPVIIHSVKSHNEILSEIKKKSLSAGGVIHGFSGSYQQAMSFWQEGFYLGVGGTITYERAKKTRKAIELLPLEAILLETDAPSMPLCGHQGERNSSLNLIEIASEVAKLKKIDISKVAEITTQNAKSLFGI